MKIKRAFANGKREEVRGAKALRGAAIKNKCATAPRSSAPQYGPRQHQSYIHGPITAINT